MIRASNVIKGDVVCESVRDGASVTGGEDEGVGWILLSFLDLKMSPRPRTSKASPSLK